MATKSRRRRNEWKSLYLYFYNGRNKLCFENASHGRYEEASEKQISKVLSLLSSLRYAYRYDLPRNYHGYGRLYSRLCGTCCRSVACVLHKEPFYCRLRLLCVGADTFFHTLRAVCTIAKNRHVFCTNIMKVTTVGKGQNC